MPRPKKDIVPLDKANLKSMIRSLESSLQKAKERLQEIDGHVESQLRKDPDVLAIKQLKKDISKTIKRNNYGTATVKIPTVVVCEVDVGFSVDGIEISVSDNDIDWDLIEDKARETLTEQVDGRLREYEQKVEALRKRYKDTEHVDDLLQEILDD